MIPKSVEQIKEKDLQELIDNSVPEGKTIEYKQALPGNSDLDKKEFLADVSSFANTSGGDLLFGVIEDREKGIPKTLEGVITENADQEIARLDGIIRDGIEPRLPKFSVNMIPLSNSKKILLIRIQKSWISPHRVSFKGHDKFYTRGSNGKYPLDVTELRNAFNLSNSINENIRDFRDNRISKIYSNESVVDIENKAKITLHIIPISSFNPAQSYNLDKIAQDIEKMKPFYMGWSHQRYNIDGFVRYFRGQDGKSLNYALLFRNGIIEVVDGAMLGYPSQSVSIPSIAFEEELIKALPEYLSVLKTLNIELPAFIFLTLIGVKDFTMEIDRRRFWSRETYPIDRDILFLPEIFLETFDIKSEEILRPCFDSLWNACGFPKSLNYDENGKWIGK